MLTSVFCTSTSTATEASTRASSSTTRIDMKKVAPAPPYCSGISTPMIPSSKQASISSRGILDSSSIFRTRGRTFSSAKSRTTSRNALLVLGEVGEGQAAECLEPWGLLGRPC